MKSSTELRNILTIVESTKKAAGRLAEWNAPYNCMADDDSQVSGHWSGTKDEIEAKLGFILDDWELTALSLSRQWGFGPMPSVTDDARKYIVGYLWEGKPSQQEWITWTDLEIKLENLQNGLEDLLCRTEQEEDFWEEQDKWQAKADKMIEAFKAVGREIPIKMMYSPEEDYFVVDENYCFIKINTKWTSLDYRRASAFGITLP